METTTKTKPEVMTPLDRELLPLYLKAVDQNLTQEKALKLGKNWLSFDDWNRVVPSLTQQQIGILLKDPPWQGGFKYRFMRTYHFEDIMEEKKGGTESIASLMAKSMITGEPFCVLTTRDCERSRRYQAEHQSKHARGLLSQIWSSLFK